MFDEHIRWPKMHSCPPLIYPEGEIPILTTYPCKERAYLRMAPKRLPIVWIALAISELSASWLALNSIRLERIKDAFSGRMLLATSRAFINARLPFGHCPDISPNLHMRVIIWIDVIASIDWGYRGFCLSFGSIMDQAPSLPLNCQMSPNLRRSHRYYLL